MSTAHALGKPRVGPAVFVTPVNPTQASKPKQGARDPRMTANELGKHRVLHVYAFFRGKKNKKIMRHMSSAGFALTLTRRKKISRKINIALLLLFFFVVPEACS